MNSRGMKSGPGELAAEHERAQIGADDRYRLDDAVGDAKAGAGEQVVGKRVAGEAFEKTERHEPDADEPVRLTRLAERTGEEDAAAVRHDRRHEQQRGPVVDLPDEQTTADVERDPQRVSNASVIGKAAQRHVVAGCRVDHDVGARPEEERQEGAGQQQDDERVQRDLAEHERPVVGKDLVHAPLEVAGEPEPAVDLAESLLQNLRCRLRCDRRRARLVSRLRGSSPRRGFVVLMSARRSSVRPAGRTPPSR